MAPFPAWRSSPPVIIYPRTRPAPSSLKTWLPHLLKALLFIGLMVVWVITIRPTWFASKVGEFTVENKADLELMGIIQK